MNPYRLPTIALTDEVLPGEAAEMASMLLAARARRGDPATSHQAAASVLEMTAKREALLWLFRAYGEMADFELLPNYASHVARHDGLQLPEQSDSGLRTRRSELVKMGKLRDSGRTRENSSGRRCVVWEVVPA
jgi:hypothetical protein